MVSSPSQQKKQYSLINISNSALRKSTTPSKQANLAS